MEDDERLDVVVDLVGVGRDLAHVVVLVQLGERGPTWLGLLALHHHHLVGLPAEHVLERRHQADDGALGPRDARDAARHVVLEGGLGARAEARERLLAVAANGHEAEVYGLAEGIDVLRLHAVALRPFLGVAVRLRVVRLEGDVALAGELVLLEEVLHLLGVRLELHRHLGRGGAEVELQRHVLLELGQDGLGTFCERVELLARQVHAQGQVGEDQVRRTDDGGHDDESDDSVKFLVHVNSFEITSHESRTTNHDAFRLSVTTCAAASMNTMTPA